MWNHIVLLLFCLLYFASAFLVLNQNIDIILKPKSCREDLPLLTIIHSAPKNVELRQAIRESWGSTVSLLFILAHSYEFNDRLKKEHEKYRDILQLNFTDAYKNMTYKHLAGYWWVENYCSHAEYVLKTDDDQAVDVGHLKMFLKEFIPQNNDHNKYFYLCYLFKNKSPKRDPENKWYVSYQEYSKDVYPDFCSGWAYVTNVNTISAILDISKEQPYFWIDDMWVTGHMLELLTKSKTVQMYNWYNNFLSEHIQHKEDILRGKMFTPELMVAGDLTSQEIKHLAEKFEKCQKKNCYDSIYKSEELKNFMKPPLFTKSLTKKTEL